jgi:hypothetical protein
MKHQKSTHASGEPSAIGPLNVPIAEAMGRGASVFGRGVSTFQQESMRFATRRLEQNVKAIEQFGACKSLPDLLSTQQRWFADMTRAYSEEWARCSELMTEMLHENGKQTGTGNGHAVKQPEPTRRADVREH